jgi:hypothetical protein
MTKELEYEEAPSGYIWLHNAKEPLMKFEEGFGFDGVLAINGDNDKIQCHFCGEWFGSLGHHLKKEHNMTASEYKIRVGLNQKTALISERTRETLIRKNLGKRMKNLRPNKKHTLETRRRIAETLKQNRMEQKNRNGTCPEQLIERLQTLASELGRTPRWRELPFKEALIKTYGSYKDACRFAGLEHRKSGQNLDYKKRTKHTKEAFVSFTREFFMKANRLPGRKDFVEAEKRHLWEKAVNSKWDKRTLFKEAVVGDGVFRKTENRKQFQFTDAELLDFIRNFEKHYGRRPSYSDAKRGFLPALSTYHYRFGGWKQALKLAGVS